MRREDVITTSPAKEDAQDQSPLPSLLMILAAVLITLAIQYPAISRTIERLRLPETPTAQNPLSQSRSPGDQQVLQYARRTNFQQWRLPRLLSERDRAVYGQIYVLQSEQRWQEANDKMSLLENRVLVGHALAKRYLHPSYMATFNELANWLRLYPNAPEAWQVYRLAQAKNPSSAKVLKKIIRLEQLEGYARTGGPASAHDSYLFRSGLESWRDGNFATSAKYFAKLANRDEDLSPWESAAAHFWTARALKKTGDEQLATAHLKQAALAARTFYGILARRELGMELDLNTASATLSREDLKYLYRMPGVVRASALCELGDTHAAEMELRHLFPNTYPSTQEKLTALTAMLDLPALQIRMGQQLARAGTIHDYALYPTPGWKPQEGFDIDPALLFAIARQESAFYPLARSPAGATGIMQLMPATARYMAKWSGNNQDREFSATPAALIEPANNIALGQSYLRYLMTKPYISGNLIYLAAAYNAGPGRVIEWQKQLRVNDDPLLFIESIPFAETRSYVLQVMTNYWIYHEILGRKPESVASLLDGRWPSYNPSHEMLARLDQGVAN